MSRNLVIRNKLESIKKINELGLNKFEECLFKKSEEESVKLFLEKYPAKYYAIRDKSKPNGIFKLKVEKNDVLAEIKEYEIFTINISSANYIENQLLVGEIEILSNNDVYVTVSTNKTYSVRDAIKNPTFNLKTTIFSKDLNEIPYFNTIYSYIVENNLQDVIVEFAIFDKEVGIKNEKIIIYELRNAY